MEVANNSKVSTDLYSWIIRSIGILEREIIFDDKLDNWFLMSSCIPVFSILGVYLLYVIYVGPKIMEKRSAYNITTITLIYNVVQIAYNLYMLSYLFTTGAITYLIQNCCTPLPKAGNPLSKQMGEIMWLYFFLKMFDLLDTVIFVLRKKPSQLTVLHVYHHALMVLATWVHLRYFKTEQAFSIGILNCFIHTIMYAYYFIAALGPTYQKHLWWKIYITRLQLVQFILFCIHQIGLVVFGCQISYAITCLIVSQSVLMFIMFSKFYYRTYINKKQKIRTQ